MAWAWFAFFRVETVACSWPQVAEPSDFIKRRLFVD